MQINQEVVLRPRFKIEHPKSLEQTLAAFEARLGQKKEVEMVFVDRRIFLKIPLKDQHYWSPQLELYFEAQRATTTVIKGVFGPQPAVWTLFMFLHFIVGSLFLAFGIWTYTRFTLDGPIAIPLFLTLLMVLIWFLLYAGGRLGKSTGKKQMHLLYDFTRSCLSP